MERKIVVVSALAVFLISLGGCATARKGNGLEVQGLKNQITVLETQLQTKEDEINSLKESIAQQQEKGATVEKQAGKKKLIGEVKSRPSTKQIQIALKNAGFDPGSTDGIMGKKTVEAIKAFQKAHNLTADGKVGKSTWDLLKENLDKKIK